MGSGGTKTKTTSNETAVTTPNTFAGAMPSINQYYGTTVPNLFNVGAENVAPGLNGLQMVAQDKAIQGLGQNSGAYDMAGGLIRNAIGQINQVAPATASTASLSTAALPNAITAQQAALPERYQAASVARTLREVIVDFLAKPGIGLAILFIVLFRFAEGQVQTIGPLFLIEPRAQGGLGLSTEQVGGIYGTAGTAAFLVGSILGGSFTAWLKLRRAMPVLILAMAVPNAAFYYLSLVLPTDLWHIGWVVAVEMAGYGFGFVGMILFIMQAVAPGRFQTAHYALGTGVMQLGFILSKTLSGDVQLLLGYQQFFLWTARPYFSQCLIGISARGKDVEDNLGVASTIPGKPGLMAGCRRDKIAVTRQLARQRFLAENFA